MLKTQVGSSGTAGISGVKRISHSDFPNHKFQNEPAVFLNPFDVQCAPLHIQGSDKCAAGQDDQNRKDEESDNQLNQSETMIGQIFSHLY